MGPLLLFFRQAVKITTTFMLQYYAWCRVNLVFVSRPSELSSCGSQILHLEVLI